MEDKLFILRVEISASVRQSTQIKFNDLRLPETVIDALQKQQSVSVRPTLSGKLKEFLNGLRIEQRKLYEECTINQGDTHFLHENYFQDAIDRIERIRSSAAKFNHELNELWSQEYERWANTVSDFLEPLFANDDDPESLKMAKEAYLTLFPTKQEFENPIQVFVLGPNPVFLETAVDADDHPLAQAMREAAIVNTTEVLEAARQGAADRACLKAAELLDDLDVRVASKVGERQTGGGKRRGSWQITCENLELIASHCPGFETLTQLAKELNEVGIQLQVDNAKTKNDAYKKFAEIKSSIRKELESIVSTRDSSAGLETLKKSLSLSGTYRDLISKIQEASSEEQLDELHSQIQVEKDVYEQRARHLQNLFEQRAELIKSASVNLDDVIAEVQAINPTSTDDLDF